MSTEQDLELIVDFEEKKILQENFSDMIKKNLPRSKRGTIGFPSGNIQEIIYSSSYIELWAAFRPPSKDMPIRRYFNSFGIHNPTATSQDIAVEVNIAAEVETAQVAGFFARDRVTREVYVMHSGKVGGGRVGVGRKQYLAWSGAPLVSASCGERRPRIGFIVSKLNELTLTERILYFAKKVQEFKNFVASGGLQTEQFRYQLESFDQYIMEFFGTKKGKRARSFEYFSYHGLVVDELRRALLSRNRKNVFNTRLVDLYVKDDGNVEEIYEIKTGTDRQTIYAAIGQLMVHAISFKCSPKKFLVIPSTEEIERDLLNIIGKLNIETIFYTLRISKNRAEVSFEL